MLKTKVNSGTQTDDVEIKTVWHLQRDRRLRKVGRAGC